MTAVGAPTEIRPMVADDLDAIRTIAASAFDCEPIHRAALVDLLYHRPTDDPGLRLVATVGGRVTGFLFASRRGDRGYVDGIAVDVAVRRRGVATALLHAVEDLLKRRGAKTLGIGGNTWYYAWPGIDLGYTAALSLAERAGYRRREVVQNMHVPLDRWIPGTAAKVVARGRFAVRRATPEDWPDLEAFINRHFTEVWRHEVDLVVHREVPSAFVAVRDDRIAGFACHGVYRRDWFGPIGTDPGKRGNGIGEALLRLCLDDLAEAGIALAQIGWIGPMSFYSRTVDARCGRQFVILEKE